ncbi:MAG TPA: hypothetical protein VM734_30985, partial [Kofleriaceae bacterium]|nr:hypothetical protein [Kofleriaceae bacterium]
MSRSRWRSLLLVVIAGCAGTPPEDPAPELVSGGRLHRDAVAHFAGQGDLRPEAVIPTMVRSIGGPLEQFDSRNLAVTVQTDSITPSGGRLTHVSMRQTVDGIPIVGTNVGLTLRPGGDSHGSRLLASSYRVYVSPEVDTQPVIDDRTAVARARARLGSGAVIGPELVIRPLGKRLELAWDVGVAGAPARAVVIASGPRAGEVELIDDRVRASNGTVTGSYATGGAPGGTGVVTSGALGGLTVSAGTATATTADDGAFTIDAPAGSTIRATLAGRALTVVAASGTALEATAPAAATVALRLGGPASGETDLAQVTAYVNAHRTRMYLEAIGFQPAAFGAPITANVNRTDTSCDAYYQNRTINFFAAGGMCKNTAVEPVVIHEYGHFVDDAYGGIQDGGLSEGWGDTLACFILDRAALPDLTDDGTVYRTCDNDYQYPPNGQAEVHDLGQAWSGFAWHVRAGLIQQLGAGPGDELARKLIFPSLSSNAADIPAAVREVFLRDDDDGDLANGTPHVTVLRAAAERHALLFAVEGPGGG